MAVDTVTAPTKTHEEIVKAGEGSGAKSHDAIACAAQDGYAPGTQLTSKASRESSATQTSQLVDSGVLHRCEIFQPKDTVSHAVDSAAGAHPDADDKQQHIEKMLAQNPALKAQVAEMRDHLSRIADPKARAEGEKGLDAMLQRGTDEYKRDGSAEEQACNPVLSQEKISETLHSLNTAMSADASALSPMTGANPEERAANRDLIIAQALRNYGDTRGIQQGDHRTCEVDSKIADEARYNPQISAEMIERTLTSKNGTVMMPDGKTPIKLDASWMLPDEEARQATGGEKAHGMSADVRLLTGLYANAVTQTRPGGFSMIFTMASDGKGAVGPDDTGDRLLVMDSRQPMQLNDGSDVDNPVIGGDDFLRLSKMTGDGGVLAANGKAAGIQAGKDDPNFVDVSSEQDLVDAIQKFGRVQVGLNAKTLFQEHGINDLEGTHITSATAFRRGPDGKLQFQIQDTNEGTSGWYSAQTLLTAVASS